MTSPPVASKTELKKKVKSEALIDKLRRQLIAAGGKLSFAKFMEIALYTPELGYYMNSLPKFGAHGDFITAPELSPLFSQALAAQSAQIITMLSDASIIEFGAGSGIMAVNILLHLEKLKCLPEHYYIIEISPYLRKQQRQTLQRECPHLLDKVIWLDAMPSDKLKAVVLANEVLDAMPVEQFTIKNGEFLQRFVTENNDQLSLLEQPVENTELMQALRHLQAEGIEFTDGYTSEINLNISTWLSNINASLQQGVILLIDYGYARQEYYHPQRDTGTLQCHYQHRVHSDPLQLIGKQDITAHVDFTAVAEAAVELNLQVLGFILQSLFLLNNDLLSLAEAIPMDETRRLQQSQQIKQLTLPSEMGELFKILALGKNIDFSLQGFMTQDILHQL